MGEVFVGDSAEGRDSGDEPTGTCVDRQGLVLGDGGIGSEDTDVEGAESGRPGRLHRGPPHMSPVTVRTGTHGYSGVRVPTSDDGTKTAVSGVRTETEEVRHLPSGCPYHGREEGSPHLSVMRSAPNDCQFGWDVTLVEARTGPFVDLSTRVVALMKKPDLLRTVVATVTPLRRGSTLTWVTEVGSECGWTRTERSSQTQSRLVPSTSETTRTKSVSSS